MLRKKEISPFALKIHYNCIKAGFMCMKYEESSAVEYVFRSRAVFFHEILDRELRERTMQSMINK
jgi:hypothetical protein